MRPRLSAVEWAAVFAVIAAVGSILTSRPDLWFAGAALATAMTASRMAVSRAWRDGRLPGWAAFVVQFALTALAVFVYEVLVNRS